MTTQTATLAGGCFWCTEAVFDDVIGVSSVESGYIGGTKPPTRPISEVCNGDTGHAEAIRLSFDPKAISYEELLDIFFHTHDPTQLNRQGNDVGTQYRSAIFPHSPEQEDAARAAIERAAGRIGTSRSSRRSNRSREWYPAEDYHQEYFEREGGSNPYCMAVVAPKLQKFRKSYAARLKRQSAGT